MEEATLRHILYLQIKSIKSEEIRTLVEQVLEIVPKAFWTREASLKYHPVDERGPTGNLTHTLRVTKLASKLADTIQHTQDEKDLLVAGAILHDCLRHGLRGEEKWSAKDHPLLVRQLIGRAGIESVWIEPLCTLIEGHMGIWGFPPVTPLANLGTILHFADYIAAQTDVEVKL